MTWALRLSKKAVADLAWFREKDRKIYVKCFDLTLALLEDPFLGIGKPERLKNLGGNVWSRRITLEHRLVYEIFEDLIVIVAYRHHYGKR